MASQKSSLPRDPEFHRDPCWGLSCTLSLKPPLPSIGLNSLHLGACQTFHSDGSTFLILSNIENQISEAFLPRLGHLLSPSLNWVIYNKSQWDLVCRQYEKNTIFGPGQTQVKHRKKNRGQVTSVLWWFLCRYNNTPPLGVIARSSELIVPTTRLARCWSPAHGQYSWISLHDHLKREL